MVAGRLLPLKQKEGSRFMPYLVGGGGLHVHALSPSWAGSKHLMGGVGGRIDLDKHPGGSAIDVQLIGLGTTPWTGQFRVGYSIQFSGKKNKGATADSGKKQEKSSTEYISYVLKEKDTLWRLAYWAKSLTDPELYPLLVDANKDVLKTPADLKPGVMVRIPQNVSEKDKEKARSDAWTAEYVPWRGSLVSKDKYDEWKTKNMKGVVAASPRAEEKSFTRSPSPTQAYERKDEYTVQTNDTLWKIACRLDIYGDCELYPLLVTANQDVLTAPGDLEPGMILKIDRTLTEARKVEARNAAWSAEYLPWRGTMVTKEKYELWKNKKAAQ